MPATQARRSAIGLMVSRPVRKVAERGPDGAMTSVARPRRDYVPGRVANGGIRRGRSGLAAALRSSCEEGISRALPAGGSRQAVTLQVPTDSPAAQGITEVARQVAAAEEPAGVSVRLVQFST